ncbi:S9 family peptidase [Chitinophaga sancti]|uniref:Dipeptidyl aminopeptidase/acylaminoacyl peptidase n=1 Tax=Chitinophaga sancti TaxID=1004 RepID=A0A1K1SI13_9BACT|nr:S9 family peptidase [Chitinophaga sancti]WQD61786.1 S9 family peptidase [Chitinophaga sancti]WQG92645.1 S9 family peptidase [Chitinophaga sancti]SFW83995.1 Dipeptidyl aminopeptidase/acylaminoacyl peptidase [Chitinophaga sancti]
MNTKPAVLALLCLTATHIAYAQKKPVAVTDMLKIKRASEVQLSPDGKHAVYTVTSIIPDTAKKKDYSYLRQLYLTDLSGKAQLLDTGATSSPAYNPSGNTIAFIRPVKGKSQIFLYYTATGTVRQLTDFSYGCSKPVWSPDGRQLVFSADISLQDLVNDKNLNPGRKVPSWNDGAPGFAHNEDLLTDTTSPDPDGDLRAIRAYLAGNAKDNKAKVITHSKFQAETFVNPEVSLSHIFITDTAAGASPRELTHGFFSYHNPVFAGNDKILIAAYMNADKHPDDNRNIEIFSVGTDGNNLTRLLHAPDSSYFLEAVSPSGKWLVSQRGSEKQLDVAAMYICPLATLANPVLVPVDRIKGETKFSADEKTIYFTAVNNGGTSLYKADVKTGKAERLTSEDEGISEFDLSGNQLIFPKTWIQDPSEIFISDLNVKAPKMITHLNTDWLSERELSIPQKFTFTNSLGLTIEYWVMKPLNFDPGKKYPVLLDMHGGPSAMWGPGEPSMWHEFQFFCGKGFGVVYCNPRGSGGYGKQFLRANYRDWGVGPSSDVLTALTKAEAQGWIDTTKRFLSGGSYAGYLTAWIVGHDHRFRAASCQRGVYDFKTFFGEGNAGKMLDNYFGGFPFVDSVKGVLEEQSPINYVKDITTPLLIFHGESDLRTGVSQSEMLFKSLNTLGRQVEYVRHPGASHELVRSGDNRQRIDQMLRTYEFFSRFL